MTASPPSRRLRRTPGLAKDGIRPMRWAVLPVLALSLALVAPSANGQTPPGPPRGAPPPNPAATSADATPPAATPLPVEAWLPRGGVDLVALDKVTARATQLSARIGEDVQYGSLTIVARRCVVRPPGVSPDAAAFLEITDSRPGVAPFRGWMLKSVPSVSIYEHPVYDIRVAGCRL
jgi:hypothetical protein